VARFGGKVGSDKGGDSNEDGSSGLSNALKSAAECTGGTSTSSRACARRMGVVMVCNERHWAVVDETRAMRGTYLYDTKRVKFMDKHFAYQAYDTQ
jgi:hypothetical protein